MTIWGQTVIWQGPPAVLTDWARVRILFHPLEPGYYAVFARLMAAPTGGTAMYEHAAYVQLSLGSATDETYARLRTVAPSGEEPIKASTPVSVMTVGKSGDDGRGGIDLIVRGRGALIVETRLNIISLDEMRDPSTHEGSYPLHEEDSPPLHVHDYSRDIFVGPAKGMRDTPEGLRRPPDS
jgi:hypothetical protein